MRRIDRIRNGRPGTATTAQRSAIPFSFDEWIGAANSPGGLQTTWGSGDTESIGTSFTGYVQQGYQRNGIVFAVILSRLLLFTEARFQFQRMENGRPGDLYGTRDLSVLERPWTNGTTGDLLAHMEQDASLAGNSYTARRVVRGRPELRRLRPDWVQIIMGSETGDVDDINAEAVGYMYWPSGPGRGKPITLLAEDVAHYAPIPDPLARHRGMSWLSPVLEEIRADSAATAHKGKFFDNAATPNMAIAPKEKLTKQEFTDLLEAHDQDHVGISNAYKTLWLGYGADVTVVGADMKQLDFKSTQGAGETRICAAGGVPPIIVGLSEGLQSATYSNYGMARRKMGDHWARPSWRSAAGALESIVPAPADSRLWYDDYGIPFLQEDRKDDAEIAQASATTIKTLVDAGYTPESVVPAVSSGDLSKLVHSGMYSVQLQALGQNGQALDPKGDG